MHIVLNEPYYIISKDRAHSFNKELEREISRGHILESTNFNAIGTRDDNDDVLFYIENLNKYAIVHLTWASEKSPLFPKTEIFNDIKELNKHINANYDE